MTNRSSRSHAHSAHSAALRSRRRHRRHANVVVAAATAPDVRIGGGNGNGFGDGDGAGEAYLKQMLDDNVAGANAIMERATGTSDATATATTATATATSASLEAPSTPPPPASFEARVDPGATFGSLLILLGFAVVNRRVAWAVDKRKDREDAEEALRQVRLRSLDGSMDEETVRAASQRLAEAKEIEASARELLVFFGTDVRVRMPQPLGKPLTQVETDEKMVEENIEKRRALERERKQSGGSGGASSGSQDSFDESAGGRGSSSSSSSKRAAGRKVEGVGGGGAEEVAKTPPQWMTATVFSVLILLTWSAVGLMFSADPAMGPALTPEQIETQMLMK